MTRSMTRQVKLFDDSTDSVLLVAPCDEYFHSVHFDDSAFPRKSHHAFQVNTAPWPHRPQLVTQPTSTSQPNPLQSSFSQESVYSLPSVPTNDQESLQSPQAAFWEAARQEE